MDRAIGQSVVAEPVSVSFGVQQWPHADDKPATEKVTYRNLGTSEVTLDLKATGTDPTGKPAPAGFFTLGADKVTVPAGGTAEVTLTADTRLGGTVDGTYSAYLVATGGGQTVRTAAAVEREVESYDVSIKHLGRDGRPAAHVDSTLFRFGAESGNPFLSPQVVDGTATIRVPKGTYVANSTVYEDPDDVTKGADWIAQPKVAVTKNTSLTFDARKAKPVQVTLPDAKAKGELFSPDYVVEEANDAVSFGWVMESPAGIRHAPRRPEDHRRFARPALVGHLDQGRVDPVRHRGRRHGQAARHRLRPEVHLGAAGQGEDRHGLGRTEEEGLGLRPGPPAHIGRRLVHGGRAEAARHPHAVPLHHGQGALGPGVQPAGPGRPGRLADVRGRLTRSARRRRTRRARRTRSP